MSELVVAHYILLFVLHFLNYLLENYKGFTQHEKKLNKEYKLNNKIIL